MCYSTYSLGQILPSFASITSVWTPNIPSDPFPTTCHSVITRSHHRVARESKRSTYIDCVDMLHHGSI